MILGCDWDRAQFVFLIDATCHAFLFLCKAKAKRRTPVPAVNFKSPRSFKQDSSTFQRPTRRGPFSLRATAEQIQHQVMWHEPQWASMNLSDSMNLSLNYEFAQVNLFVFWRWHWLANVWAKFESSLNQTSFPPSLKPLAKSALSNVLLISVSFEFCWAKQAQERLNRKGFFRYWPVLHGQAIAWPKRSHRAWQ